MKLLLLFLAILAFVLAAIAGFGHASFNYAGWVATGFALFAASFLPTDRSSLP